MTATAPPTRPLLLAPTFERVPTGPLPALSLRGGRHRAPTRAQRRLGRVLVALALAFAPHRLTRTETS